MLSKVATLAAIVAGAHAQSACTLTPETHPSMTWSKCAEGGTCTSQEGSVVIDSNWRWLHTTDGYVNCYTGNEWDAALCPSNAECATSCCLDGAEYEATYGASTSGNALTLKFVTEGEFSTNIGSRLYLLESESKYQGFTLLGNEFTFDVDVSNLEWVYLS